MFVRRFILKQGVIVNIERTNNKLVVNNFSVKFISTNLVVIKEKKAKRPSSYIKISCQCRP